MLCLLGVLHVVPAYHWFFAAAAALCAHQCHCVLCAVPVQIFQVLGGNTGCNSIWEAQLPSAAAGVTSQAESVAASASGGVRRVQHTDSWVWGDDDDAVSQS